MVNGRREEPPGGAIGTPQEYPSVPPPRELYQTSDIRFVMVEIGKLTTSVEALVRNVEKLDRKVT